MIIPLLIAPEHVDFEVIVASKKVKAAERIIAPRTDYYYYLSPMRGGKVRIHGRRKDGTETQIIVKL